MASKKLTWSKKDDLVAKVVEEGATYPCSFCHHDVNDEVLYGKLYSIGELYCHYFCVLLSCCLIQKGEDEQGLLGFLYTDIKAELERSKKHKCSYCGKDGATLGCVVQQCRKQFHVPCGHRKDAVSLFYGNYRTYCEKHAPRQEIPGHIMDKAKQRLQVERKAKRNPKDAVQSITVTTSPSKLYDDESPTKPCICVLCYELVEGYPSPRTFWPSCCGTDQWFHRKCLQRMALTAGMHYLKCPLCNDKESFYQAIMEQGYYVPDRDAAWEFDQTAFQDMYERQIECCAAECMCQDGRDRDDDTGDWCITLCLLCGSNGIHNGCYTENRFICNTCTPAAPQDLDGLEKSLAKVIAEEQRRKAVAAAAVIRPVMPSRMSIRRTKGLVNNKIRPSTSGCTVTNSQQNVNVPEPRDLSNTKLSRIELNLSSPKKRTRFSDITNQNPAFQSAIKTENNASPIKIIEENVQARIKEYNRLGVNGLILESDDIFEKIKLHMQKPRPLCVKKRIVNKILDHYLAEAVHNKSLSPSSKSPTKLWTTPKKDYIKEIKESTTPKRKKVSPLKICILKTPTPKKIKEISISDTPLKSSQVMINDDDESSTSTFDLPPEFIAETTSDYYDTPEKKIIVDEANVISISDKIIEVSPENSNLEHENTVNKAVIDVDTFKSQYLQEMFKCEFNHKHDKKEESPRLKTAMSFAVKAALEKNESETKKEGKALKRKLASKKKKRRAKKLKMAAMENNVDVQFNNDEAQIEIQYDKKKKKKNRKKDKTRLSIQNKNIKLKIKFQEKKMKFKITERKKEKAYKINIVKSPNELKQTVINFSPENCVQISEPVENLKAKSKNKIKKEQKNDNFMQTSLHSFFKTGS